ncbi:hypothetical protein ACIQWR_03360 [Streptomyces sp. NPDC098789]|uniref:hypothetical protein n=1 Tax=Streptomyces sp. NPDC098789 TaxID=3366098 RepID=UPI00382B8E29
MSRRTDNRHRVATICREATGLAHHTCMRWAAEGLITRALPVPDAESPAQRAFEARVVVALAAALSYEQEDGVLLGVTVARPTAAGLGIELHPDMSHRVFDALVPRFDPATGVLVGVPGLRRGHRGDGGLHVWCAAGGGAVRFLPSAPAWQRPTSGSGLIALGRADAPLHRAERARLDGWARGPAERDRLLSRLLRRPRLLNTAGAGHGWANTHSHHDEDLVIEWCCGPQAGDLAQQLRRSGLAAPPVPPDTLTLTRPEPGVVSLGSVRVTLRSLRWPGCAAC